MEPWKKTASSSPMFLGLFQRYLVGVFMVPLLMFWEVPNSWIPWLQGISASPTKDLQAVLGLSMYFILAPPKSMENKKTLLSSKSIPGFFQTLEYFVYNSTHEASHPSKILKSWTGPPV